MTTGKKPTAREFFYSWALEDGDRFVHDIFDDTIQEQVDEPLKEAIKNSDQDINEIRDNILNFSDTHSNHPGVNHNVNRIIEINSDWIPSPFFEDLFAGVVRETDIAALSSRKDSEFSGRLVTYSLGMMHSAMFFADMFKFYALPPQNHSMSSARQQNEFIFNVLRIFNWWRLNEHQGELSETNIVYEEFAIERSSWASVACAGADQFIVGHEIAHHLVGDTGFLPHVSDELEFIDGFVGALKDALDTFFPDDADRKELKADAVSLFLSLGKPSASNQCSAIDLNIAAVGTLFSLGAMSILTDKGRDEIAFSSQAIRRFLVMRGLITGLVRHHEAETAEEEATNEITLRLVTLITEFVDTLLKHRHAWQAKLDPGEI